MTNTVDTLLVPSGEEIIRSEIVSQRHVYSIPGNAPVTNCVPIMTNSVHLRRAWIRVDKELPLVPKP